MDEVNWVCDGSIRTYLSWSLLSHKLQSDLIIRSIGHMQLDGLQTLFPANATDCAVETEDGFRLPVSRSDAGVPQVKLVSNAFAKRSKLPRLDIVTGKRYDRQRALHRLLHQLPKHTHVKQLHSEVERLISKCLNKLPGESLATLRAQHLH